MWPFKKNKVETVEERSEWVRQPVQCYLLEDQRVMRAEHYKSKIEGRPEKFVFTAELESSYIHAPSTAWRRVIESTQCYRDLWAKYNSAVVELEKYKEWEKNQKRTEARMKRIISALAASQGKIIDVTDIDKLHAQLLGD